jgi:hypothetical protein
MKRIAIGLLAVIVMTGMLTLAVPRQAGADSSAAFTAAYTVSGHNGGGTSMYQCLLYYNVASGSQDLNLMIWDDTVIAQTGAVCGPRGLPAAFFTTPNAVEGSTPDARAHNAGSCNGTWSNGWNINGHTTSSWLFTQWGAIGCWTEQPAGTPFCVPGDSAPFYSVAIFACNTSSNPGVFVTVARVVFVVTFNFSFLGVGASTQNTYWYWMNMYSNGATETGCHVGFC